MTGLLRALGLALALVPSTGAVADVFDKVEHHHVDNRGLDPLRHDGFLLTDGHNGVWNWVTGPITVRTRTGVGHFIQQDAADLVTHTIYE